jgi:hypothetical protein
VNYRDDLEKRIRETLNEGFEIVSVTFHDDKVEPRGFGRPEWRETPIAYVLLKAKDARVDRIPALQLDLDFLDRRGKVILPIESQVLLLDARPDRPPARPLDKLALTQILDERELKSGRLTLEIKAAGRGLIPDLADVIDPGLPGFQLEKTNDHGLTITKMDDGDTVAPLAERNWVLNYVTSGGGAVPGTFQFPKAKLPTSEVAFKHYADADLLDVKESFVLEGLPLRPANYAGWVLSGVVFVLCVVGLFLLLRQAPGGAIAPAAAYAMPAQVTPFTVLNLLRRMEQDTRLGLPTDRRTELAQAIRDLEQRYFGPRGETNGQADLERLAREWVGRTGFQPVGNKCSLNEADCEKG